MGGNKGRAELIHVCIIDVLTWTISFIIDFLQQINPALNETSLNSHNFGSNVNSMLELVS